MSTKTLSLHNLEQKTVWLLLLAVLGLTIFYIYFVNSSIVHSIARERNEESIAQAQTEVSGLVSEYLALFDQINSLDSAQFGFVDASKKTSFIVRGPRTVVLTLLDNEI